MTINPYDLMAGWGKFPLGLGSRGSGPREKQHRSLARRGLPEAGSLRACDSPG